MENINAKQFFYIPCEEEQIFGTLDQLLDDCGSEFEEIGRAFRHNLHGAFVTVSVPFQMAAASVQNRRFQQLHIAESIRAQADDGKASELAEEQALEKARNKFREEINSKGGTKKLADGVLAELASGLKYSGLEKPAAELIRQSSVLIWTAFEILCRDLFIKIINGNPALCLDLAKDPRTSKIFQLKKIDIITLAEYGFNLSNSMGKLFEENCDFSNIENIKQIFDVLMPDNNNIRKHLSKREIWELNQTRHCIVHNRGIADANYANRLGVDDIIGTEIELSPSKFENYLMTIKDVGCSILESGCEI